MKFALIFIVKINFTKNSIYEEIHMQNLDNLVKKLSINFTQVAIKTEDEQLGGVYASFGQQMVAM